MKPDFYAFLDHLARTLLERNERYGTKNIAGPAQLLGRIDDKIARLRDAVNRGEAAPNDWTDLAGYSGIGWLLEHGLWDNRSSVRRVYLAHPSEMPEEAFVVSDVLAQTGYAIYWPVRAFKMMAGGSAGHADWIWETNLEAIRRADMIVALMPRTTPGVCAELLFGRITGKTVWVWTPHEYDSSLVNWAADRVFRDVEGLIQEVRNRAISTSADAADAKANVTVRTRDAG